MDHHLISPNRALVDTLNQQFNEQLKVMTRSFGAGAIRVERQGGAISVPVGGGPTTLVQTNIDPGDWVIGYFACLRNDLFGGATGDHHDLNLNLDGVPGGSSAEMRRYFAGDHTDQIGRVVEVELGVVTTLTLGFSWTSSDGSPSDYSAHSGFISMVPA